MKKSKFLWQPVGIDPRFDWISRVLSIYGGNVFRKWNDPTDDGFGNKERSKSNKKNSFQLPSCLLKPHLHFFLLWNIDINLFQNLIQIPPSLNLGKSIAPNTLLKFTKNWRKVKKKWKPLTSSKLISLSNFPASWRVSCLRGATRVVSYILEWFYNLNWHGFLLGNNTYVIMSQGVSS